MSQKWHILFCDQKYDPCPVTDFINDCPPKHQVKILRFLTLLEDSGPTLPRPYADLLYDGIHELRIKLSGDHMRILYFFCYRKFIVLYHAFIKSTDRVPDKIVRQVIDYRDHLLAQVDARYFEKVVHENV